MIVEYEATMLLIRNLLKIVVETRKMVEIVGEEDELQVRIFLTVLQRPEILWR